MGAFGKIRKALVAGGAGLAALAAVNAALGRGRQLPEADEVPAGEAFGYSWRHGTIHYVAGGDVHAPPLVFVHGVGVGASALDWRQNFSALARDFRVYAFDLLGFGFSDKPPTAHYSAELYTELIADFIRDVAGGRQTRVVGHSLGAAYAVHAADQHPSLIDALLLVSPIGAGASQARPGMTNAAFYGLLHSPVLGTSFYNAMASERSLRDEAARALFYDKRLVTDGFIARSYALSHQPGAQYALTAYFSGYLNTDLRAAFARLAQPVTLVWGKQDATNPLANAEALRALNSRASLEVFDRARSLPHQEHPEQFNALARQKFLARSAA